MLVVFQLKKLSMSDYTFGWCDKPNFPQDFRKVAIVDCDSLEMGYELTQANPGKPWGENEGVNQLEISRSTSEGDVFQKENGELWYVDGIGFKQF